MNEVVFKYNLIIIDQARSQVLITSDEEGIILPHLEITAQAQDSWWKEAARLNRAVQENFGLRVVTLEALAIDNAFLSNRAEGVFILENHSLPRVDLGKGYWVSLDKIATLKFADDKQGFLLNEALANFLEPGKPLSGSALSWTMPGWFEKVETWLETQLVEINSRPIHQQKNIPTGPLEQVRNWFLSCILRLPTTGGVIYFKAAPLFYAYEAVLTQIVAEQQPELAPPVVNLDPTQSWLVMEEVKGKRLDQAVNSSKYIQYWESLLTNFATLQIDLVERAPFLIGLGLPDWRPSGLSDQIEALLPVIAELLGETELIELQNRLPSLKAACKVLAESNLPATLHHGDLHSGNILANEAGYRLLDWAGFCAVSHPFISMTVPFYEELATLSQRDHLKTRYLAPWKNIYPDKDLETLFEVALPLGVICGILGHARQLSQARKAWEKKQEQDNLLYYVKLLIQLTPL